MKRQGLVTTIGELRKITDELEKEIIRKGFDSKFQLNIINKEGLSDTWKFENALGEKDDE